MVQLPQKAWFVIAAFNEGQRISGVLEELSKVNANIVVVDDCSSDNTAEVCRRYNCHLLRHPVNLGQGAALQTGNEYALAQGAEFIIHFDGDGQMQLKDVPAMIAPLVDGVAEVTLGSRYLNGATKVPLSKKFFIHLPAIYLHWLMTGLKLSDAHCGFRAFGREAAQKCVITQNRYAHATEIIDLIATHRLIYQEVPVEIKYHRYGQNFRNGLDIIRDLFHSRMKL